MASLRGQEETFGEFFCPTERIPLMGDQLTILSVIHSLLAITTVLGNGLILIALKKEQTQLHPPSKLLIQTLALADLCVGIVVQPLTVTGRTALLTGHRNVCHFVRDAVFLAGLAAFSVSFLTVTAISVDRLLALLLKMRYRQVVTTRRIYLVVTAFWGQAVACTALYFLNYQIIFRYAQILISMCLITSVVCYMKISLSLRRQVGPMENQGYESQRSPNFPLHMARFKKTVSNAVWIQGALLLCCFPHLILMAFAVATGQTVTVGRVRGITLTFVFLNSTLNPILYCWKVREIKQAVKNIVRKLFTSGSQDSVETSSR